MKLGPLTTTSVGSFPRPRWLGETNRSRVKFVLAGETLKEAQDDATIIALKEQEGLGLDILTDGEQRRESFIFHAAQTWDGFDAQTLGHTDTYRNRPADRMVPRISGKIKRRATAGADDVRFAKAHTALQVKVAVGGPMSVIDSTANQFYDDEDELAQDIAVAVNGELRDLQAAGADVIQIDEPAMTRYHDKVRDYGAAALDRCLAGITVPTIVHLCYGYPGGDGLQHQYTYDDLLPELMKTRISGFTVEFGRSDFDPEVLKACGDRLVMFGCIDPGDTPAPTVESVKRRVAGVLEYLDPNQVLLAPDCGLMTISRALAHDKLAAMVGAAKDLRKTL